MYPHDIDKHFSLVIECFTFSVLNLVNPLSIKVDNFKSPVLPGHYVTGSRHSAEQPHHQAASLAGTGSLARELSLQT